MSSDATSKGNSNSENAHTGLPHGTILGKTKCGVIAYNCNYGNNPEADKNARAYDYGNFENGVYTGMKWQCVEFARRYWFQQKQVLIPTVQWAAHMMKFKEVYRIRNGKYFVVPLIANYNGGTVKPEAHDLLIYKSTVGQRVGHVAVVLEVTDKNIIYVGEQNQENDKMWESDHADELTIQVGTSADGKPTYSIQHSDPDLERKFYLYLIFFYCLQMICIVVDFLILRILIFLYFLIFNFQIITCCTVDGWLRLDESSEYPRPDWKKESDIIPVDGVYAKETAQALQKFVGVSITRIHVVECLNSCLIIDCTISLVYLDTIHDTVMTIFCDMHVFTCTNYQAKTGCSLFQLFTTSMYCFIRLLLHTILHSSLFHRLILTATMED
jgi:glutathionylspermidine amidase/synthetase